MRGFLVAAIPAICCACGPSSGPAHDSRPEPVVVYAAYSDENYLPELFSGFTRETGIPVTVRHRDEEQNISDVIGNSGSPRADVLLARTVQGIWRAADEGALLPLRSAAVEKNIPEILRDPDGYWVAAGVELAVIASKAGDVVPVAGYGNLIDPVFDGRLCLSSSASPVNRGVIAQLIAELGARPAELMIRSWIRNLATPPLDSEALVIDAIVDGRCGAGLVSRSAARQAGLAVSIPMPASATVEAAGIARHARNPDAAKRLVEWLTGEDAQRSHSERRGHFAANRQAAAQALPEIRHPAAAGAFDEDAVKLAERAAWH